MPVDDGRLIDRCSPAAGYRSFSGAWTLSSETSRSVLDTWSLDAARAATDRRLCVEQLRGRYWIARHQAFPNLTGSDSTLSVTSDESGVLSDEPEYNFQLSVGLCAPAACSGSAVRRYIAPLYIRSVVKKEWELVETYIQLPNLYRRMAYIRYLVATEFLSRTHALLSIDEVGDWSQLHLSWAIVGFSGCGTSSLAANLQKHPAFEVLTDGNHAQERFEDGQYFDKMRIPLLLPTVHEVHEFNAWKRKPAQVDYGAYAARLRGVKHPFYVRSQVGIARLASIPGLRVFVLVRNPLERIESLYLNFWECTHFKNASPEVPPLRDCWDKACGPRALQEPWCAPAEGDSLRLDVDKFLVASHIRAVQARIGSKSVFLADREALAAGRDFYKQVTSFFKVEDFPTGTSFNKVNVAIMSTKVLRKKVLKRVATTSTSDAQAAHEALLAKLSCLFMNERRELRSLFSELPPRLTDHEWPAWLEGACTKEFD